MRRSLFFLAHVAENVASSAALAANAYASDSSSSQATASLLHPLLSLFEAVVGTSAVPRLATEETAARAEPTFSDEIVNDQEVKEKVCLPCAKQLFLACFSLVDLSHYTQI